MKLDSIATFVAAAGSISEDRAAETAVSAPYWNPRPVDRTAIRALLDDAYNGRRPQV